MMIDFLIILCSILMFCCFFWKYSQSNLKLFTFFIILKDKKKIRKKLISFYWWRVYSSFNSNYSFIHILAIISFLTLLLWNSDIPLLNTFRLDYQKSNSLIDSRINGLATLFSVSIAIIFFILNAYKDKGEEQYFIAFRVSKMYPTLYLILITLLIIIFLNFRNYTIDFDIAKSELTANKLVTLTFVLIYACIIMIAVTIFLIYKMTFSNILLGSYNKYLEKIQNHVDINNYKNNISGNIYRDSMLNYGASDIYFHSELKDSHFIVNTPYKSTVKNIKLIKLKKLIVKSKMSNNIFFKKLYLDQPLAKNEPLMYLPKTIHEKNLIKFSKVFKFKKNENKGLI